MWGAFGAPHMPLNFVNGEEIWFMLKKRPGMLFIILTFLISACSSQASPNSTAVAASPTVVDPCSAEERVEIVRLQLASACLGEHLAQPGDERGPALGDRRVELAVRAG